MELLAAIDLLQGTAVRLEQGDFERRRGYGDPLALAERFLAAGARWLHVVDLDAARTGAPSNRPLVLAICERAAAAGVPVQCGGGVRTEDDAAQLLAGGARRVVFGTAALEDPASVCRSAEAHPERVAVGLDYRRAADGGMVAAARGWVAEGGRPLHRVLDDLAGAPLGAVVVTAIERDGTLEGPDEAGLGEVLDLVPVPVIASGGVGGAADLRRLARLRGPASGRMLEGVVVGKALVDGRVELEEALAACAASG